MMRASMRQLRRLWPVIALAGITAGCASSPAAYNRFAPPEDQPSLLQRADEAMDRLEFGVQRIDEWLTRTF